MIEKEGSNHGNKKKQVRARTKTENETEPIARQHLGILIARQLYEVWVRVRIGSRAKSREKDIYLFARQLALNANPRRNPRQRNYCK